MQGNVWLHFHHDVEPLPNGHWLVLANTTMTLSPHHYTSPDQHPTHYRLRRRNC